MVEIVTSKQAQIAAKLDFCYMCGKPFTIDNPPTRDHIPPKGIFLKEDRNWPLILPAHKHCNAETSISDEQARDLLALLQPGGASALPLKTKLIGTLRKNGETSVGLLKGLRLSEIVSKVFRACYTALYGECLPMRVAGMILTPLPIFDPKTNSIARETFHPQHPEFCELLKNQRRMDKVDRVHACNGKFRFEAVWTVDDQGKYKMFIFGIDIYEWHQLATEVLDQPIGCIGFCPFIRDKYPKEATVANKIIKLPYTYSEPLNPFETW